MDQTSPTPAGFIQDHSMRRIVLDYTPGKTVLTPQDEQLLEKHIQLHDFEYQLLKNTEKVFHSFNSMVNQVTSLKEYLTKIKGTLNETIEMADKLSATTYVPEETSLERIIAQNASTADELIDYHRQINLLYNELKDHQELLNKCITASDEGSRKVYNEYDEAAVVHNTLYLTNTIDIVSLDDDLNNFRCTQTVYEQRRSFFMDSCQEVLTSYAALNLETSTLYGVWTEFSKRCGLMQVVADLRNSQTTPGVN